MKREKNTPTSDDVSGLDVKPDLTPNPSPAKRAKTTLKKGAARQGDGSKSRSGPPWTPEMRIKLFEAYQQAAAINWSVVAGIMGDGMTPDQCRKQWQRATGAKIRQALEK